MSPELVTSIYTNTAWVVGIILSAGALATAFAWGIIASKYLESLARQPEMRAQLLGQMLFAGGLMEAFPLTVCRPTTEESSARSRSAVPRHRALPCT